MTDGAHHWPVRVYFEDTDAGGIVYHTAYLRFAERGRTEFLRSLGFDHRSLFTEAGGNFVVRSMAIDFAGAARLDDDLVVVSRVASVSGARLAMEQTVFRGDDRLVTLEVGLAFLKPDGRPARLPEAVRKAFADNHGT